MTTKTFLKENAELIEENGQNQVLLLDREKGLKYCGKMEELYAEILQMFCDLSEEKIAELQRSFEHQDWKNYIIQIHALKSTSLSVGGIKISEMAFKLEQAGKSEDYIYIIKNHDEAMEVYVQTVNAGRQYLSK